MSVKTSRTITDNGLTQVQDQYENLPYPMRDPEDDKERLITTIGEWLAELNHWLYKGKQDFKSGFRVLIAGGGTGDSSTFLAEQLKHTDAEIVYLDFSQASMEIAKKRAQIRGLKNITFILDSILNIPKLKLGKFDFINCSGVLHHLASPDEGLAAIQESLKPTGGMSLMVYGQIGRTGIYHIQDIMKIVNSTTNNMYESISNAKLIMQALPQTNWFMRGRDLFSDDTVFGDIGLYDMFLHKQDRAYTTEQMHEFVTKAGLHFSGFSTPIDRLRLKISTYVRDVTLLQKLTKLSAAKQQAICELMCGNLIKHGWYVSNDKNSVASVEDLDNIPYLFNAHDNIIKTIYDGCVAATTGAQVAITFNLGWVQNLPVFFTNGAFTQGIFKHMNNEKTLREIFNNIRSDVGRDIHDDVLIKETKKAFEPLFEIGILLLRHKSIKPFKHDEIRDKTA